jgi:autotransporter translocation and assembly factor TamB
MRLLFKILLSCLLVIFIIGYFLGETTPGLQTTLHFASRFLPGKLKIEHSGGKLFSEFYLINLSYEDPNKTITIHSLHFHWLPRGLMHGMFKVHHLNMNGVKIDYHDTTTTQQPPFDINRLILLKHISIKHAGLYHVTLMNNQKVLAKFQDIELGQSRTLTSFYAKSDENQIQGSLFSTWEPKPAWLINLHGKNINPGIFFTEWPGNFNFSLRGQYSMDAASIQLTQLNGSLRGYSISGRIDAELRNQQLNIHQANLAIGNTTLQMQGTLADSWNMKWNFSVPNLATLLPHASGNMKSAGNITGSKFTPQIDASLQANQLNFTKQHIGRLNTQIHLALQPEANSALNLNAYDIKLSDYTIQKIALNITGKTHQDKQNLTTHFDIAINKMHYLTALLTVPNSINTHNYRTVPIAAAVNINLFRLATLQELIPHTKNLTGTIQGNLAVKGNLNQPRISGQMALLNGNVTLPMLGITLTHINLQASGNESGNLTYTGKFQSGNGTASLQGATQFFQAGFPTTLSFTGNNLQAINLPEYKVAFSPNIQFNLSQANLTMQGNIFISSADISPKNFSSTITLPEEVVFVGQKQSTTNSLLNAFPTTQVTVTLGNDVHISYQDLTAQLGGHIVINKSPNNFATATGELYTQDGSYQAYNQTLKIQEGRLIYTGGMLTNPGLNIKATRNIKTVIVGSTSSFTTSRTYGGTEMLTVGVQVLGTLNEPAISLFSIPADLTQTDILSYLILGIPSSQTSGGDSQTLLSAASALNLGGSGQSQFGNMTKELQQKFGLSELNVESTQTFNPSANAATSTTSLVVGKQIANHLYVHYSIGLFNPISVFNLRYQFSKHWSIQSETSTIDNGADLMYTIERE